MRKNLSLALMVITSALLGFGAGCARFTGPVISSKQVTSTMQTSSETIVPLAFPGILSAEKIHDKQIRIVTEKGDVVFKLLDGEGPKAASNFVYLAERGYYDSLRFHRVVPGFVIQGGDPKGNGTGGPGYQFSDEPVKLPYTAGIVAMANAGPNTNGSQFFIVTEDQPSLPPAYTIFGRVTSGMEVVRAIVAGDVMGRVSVEPAR